MNDAEEGLHMMMVEHSDLHVLGLELECVAI